ncbi:MAG: hypothetical protein KF773_10920 [Deltaproteobacteria bacterium]|nr:hypothetical protein [Deltaproteobacteria bacterium]
MKALSAVVACTGAPPAGVDAAVVAGHCKATADIVNAWRTKWRDKAVPFFTGIHKNAHPAAVVYPFGGGDLLNALAVYPSATEYTTLSLEGMGDPRTLDALSGAGKRDVLATQLQRLRKTYEMNLGWAWNTTVQLSLDSGETGQGLPGILALALVAIDANGYELVEARYWHPTARGDVQYLTQRDVDAWDAAGRKSGKKITNAVQQGAFNDIELVFRKKGDPSAPAKTFRHLTGDLSDGGIKADGSSLAYLEQRKEVAAITKAASYHLWKDAFSKVRGYLLSHMKVMLSDDTGIPPRHAKAAGFTQEVWGTYTGTFFNWAPQDTARELVELFKGNKREMPYKFGYYDNRNRSVLLVTRK